MTEPRTPLELVDDMDERGARRLYAYMYPTRPEWCLRGVEAGLDAVASVLRKASSCVGDVRRVLQWRRADAGRHEIGRRPRR